MGWDTVARPTDRSIGTASAIGASSERRDIATCLRQRPLDGPVQPVIRYVVLPIRHCNRRIMYGFGTILPRYLPILPLDSPRVRVYYRGIPEEANGPAGQTPEPLTRFERIERMHRDE